MRDSPASRNAEPGFRFAHPGYEVSIAGELRQIARAVPLDAALLPKCYALFMNVEAARVSA